MMSKYSVAFFIVSIVAALLFTPHRKILFNKHFWFAGFAGFIIFLPNILWQFQNRLPIIFHMRELAGIPVQYVVLQAFLLISYS